MFTDVYRLIICVCLYVFLFIHQWFLTMIILNIVSMFQVFEMTSTVMSASDHVLRHLYPTEGHGQTIFLDHFIFVVLSINISKCHTHCPIVYVTDKDTVLLVHHQFVPFYLILWLCIFAITDKNIHRKNRRRMEESRGERGGERERRRRERERRRRERENGR